MAEIGRMTVEELAGRVLADEHGDWLREGVAFPADALMEAGVERSAAPATGSAPRGG